MYLHTFASFMELSVSYQNGPLEILSDLDGYLCQLLIFSEFPRGALEQICLEQLRLLAFVPHGSRPLNHTRLLCMSLKQNEASATAAPTAGMLGAARSRTGIGADFSGWKAS
jgi:hypothetical protein